MIKTSIEKMAYDIGKDIGHVDDETQGKLLNGFCHALKQIPNNNFGTQLCYITDQLTAEAKEVLIELGGFCEESK